VGSSSAKPGMILFVMGILGLFIAAIEQIAYDKGYWLTKYITDASQLPGLQIITIVVFLLGGGVLAALTAR
jgi:hypothetical protein